MVLRILHHNPSAALRSPVRLPIVFIGWLQEILHAFWGEPALAGIRSRWQSRFLNFAVAMRF